jgi:hypothetical protein
MLLVGDGGGRLGELAPLLPQARPHVLLLQQGVELRQGVQDLLVGRRRREDTSEVPIITNTSLADGRTLLF